MVITCLDMEGVVTPEIWIAFADAAGIPALRRTTRDEPDYGKLMQYRMDILREHNLGIREIKEVIQTIDPLPGAKEFLEELRTLGPTVIITDSFDCFVGPLQAKLGWPMILCNELVVAEDGFVTGVKMRCPETKLTSVRSFQNMGLETIGIGDSFNDLAMIRAGKAGFLFRSTQEIKEANPDLQEFTEYDELLEAIREAIEK